MKYGIHKTNKFKKKKINRAVSFRCDNVYVSVLINLLKQSRIFNEYICTSMWQWEWLFFYHLKSIYLWIIKIDLTSNYWQDTIVIINLKLVQFDV